MGHLIIILDNSSNKSKKQPPLCFRLKAYLFDSCEKIQFVVRLLIWALIILRAVLIWGVFLFTIQSDREFGLLFYYQVVNQNEYKIFIWRQK